MSLAENLRVARAASGLSQQAVADSTGIPRTAVSDIEHGKREVGALELKALANLFGTSADALLGGEPPQLSATDPATLLRDTLAKLEITQAELARRTGLSVKHINQIAQDLKPISSMVALRFERATGVSSAEWHRAAAERQDRLLRRRPRVWWSPRLGVLEELAGSVPLEVIRVVTNTVLAALPDDATELLPVNQKGLAS
ncbi:hypothetical protein BBK82_03575 [Lentzea guizhouensis]|uniref:HTH cro/C1-type domain-containing protein n=1 Tax=Lentzea guizhouensis TaxID=1586287 RepID=A0A1B2HC92_9PSEU|nr:helix-turn-helix transcriptional regulator [Lentzea guizhouensis]ANZ35296.1 hypothetical protein BBK82_03575 [Lentzea guizhouensis]